VLRPLPGLTGATREPGGRSPDPPPAPAPVRLRCFGGFRLEVGPETVDPRTVKPRARKLLHLLALHGGQPVHREVLIEALWPGAEPEAGARSLHVAVSAVRQLLGADPCRGAVTIEREGEDYRLAAPPPAEGGGRPATYEADVVTLVSRTEDGRAREAAGDREGAIAAFAGALAAHTGDLLPEDGPDEWVVRARERFRAQAVDAARHLADLHLAAGQPLAAVRACELGLDIDPARDELWRRLQQAHFSAGNHAAAAATQRRYEQMLEDLGLT
jgi:DNA-binding SARP family transcriptional activator